MDEHALDESSMHAFTAPLDDGGTGSWSALSSRCLTAACYVKPTLHLVTVRRAGFGYMLEDQRCGSCLFDNRDAAATRDLQPKLQRFLRRHRIKRLVLRSGPMRGTYMPHALAFKAEAILDRALGRGLIRVDNASVANWLRKQELVMPEPQDLGFTRAWRDGQRKAIEAAVYVMAGGKIACSATEREE